MKTHLFPSLSTDPKFSQKVTGGATMTGDATAFHLTLEIGTSAGAVSPPLAGSFAPASAIAVEANTLTLVTTRGSVSGIASVSLNFTATVASGGFQDTNLVDAAGGFYGRKVCESLSCTTPPLPPHPSYPTCKPPTPLLLPSFTFFLVQSASLRPGATLLRPTVSQTTRSCRTETPSSSPQTSTRSSIRSRCPPIRSR